MKNCFLIISLFFISFSYSQDLGMSPLDYPLKKSMEKAYVFLKNKTEEAIKIYLNQKNNVL